MLRGKKIFFFFDTWVEVCVGFMDLHEPYKDLSFFVTLWLTLQGLEWSNEAGEVVLELVARQNKEESLHVTCSYLQRNISASDARAEPENHGGH